jgi:hypothetical protein
MRAGLTGRAEIQDFRQRFAKNDLDCNSNLMKQKKLNCFASISGEKERGVVKKFPRAAGVIFSKSLRPPQSR